MYIEEFVDRLDKAKPRAQGGYLACCPAHDDKSPSMLVSEGHDGQVIVKCFAGCTHVDIVESIGLTVQDLFNQDRDDYIEYTKPAANDNPSTPVKVSKYYSQSMLRQLHLQVLYCVIFLTDLKNKKPISDQEAAKYARCWKNLEQEFPYLTQDNARTISIYIVRLAVLKTDILRKNCNGK